MHQTIGPVTTWVSVLAERCKQRVRAPGGQATVEYVALVMLVALVMFGVIAAMKTYKFAEGQQLALLIIKKIEEAVKQVKY